MLTGCAPSSNNIMQLSAGSRAKAAYQTFQVEARSEQELLNRAVTLLQDLGYQMVFANSELGILFAEKAPGRDLVFRTILSEGPFTTKPTPPGFRLGIVITSKQAEITNHYLLRLRMLRVWRHGAHQQVALFDEYEQASLYQKLYQLFTATRR